MNPSYQLPVFTLDKFFNIYESVHIKETQNFFFDSITSLLHRWGYVQENTFIPAKYCTSIL